MEDSDEAWMNQVKQGVKATLGGNKWDDSRWTAFMEEAAVLLREGRTNEADMKEGLAGLIKYGIGYKEDLKDVSNNKERFRKALELEGVRPAISDKLFKAYVQDQQQVGKWRCFCCRVFFISIEYGNASLLFY